MRSRLVRKVYAQPLGEPGKNSPVLLSEGIEVVHPQQLGVTAGDQEGQRRRGQRPVFQGVRRDVPGEVVDPEQGHVPGGRVGLGRGHADQQRTGQPGSGGHGDRVHLSQLDTGAGQCTFQGRRHGLQMGTRGDFGHHAAEAFHQQGEMLRVDVVVDIKQTIGASVGRCIRRSVHRSIRRSVNGRGSVVTA